MITDLIWLVPFALVLLAWLWLHREFRRPRSNEVRLPEVTLRLRRDAMAEAARRMNAALQQMRPAFALVAPAAREANEAYRRFGKQLAEAVAEADRRAVEQEWRDD